MEQKSKKGKLMPSELCKELGLKLGTRMPYSPTEETRQKISDAQKKNHQLKKQHCLNIPKPFIYPEELEFKSRKKKKIIIKKGPSPYSLNFYNPKFRKQILDRDNNQCQNPDCDKNPSRYSLQIHHIDYDKKNSTPQNLITLCPSCNIQANYNKPYWINLYQNIIKQHNNRKEIEK